MTDTEQSILDSLLELEQAIQSMQTVQPKPDLQSLFARIDELARQLPPNTDRDLLHYLQKKSYQKARFFLQGRDAENTAGNCGHV
jgi:hypothetical protein